MVFSQQVNIVYDFQKNLAVCWKYLEKKVSFPSDCAGSGVCGFDAN